MQHSTLPRKVVQLSAEPFVTEDDRTLCLQDPESLDQREVLLFYDVSEAEGGTAVHAHLAVYQDSSAFPPGVVDERSRLLEMPHDRVMLVIQGLELQVRPDSGFVGIVRIVL